MLFTDLSLLLLIPVGLAVGVISALFGVGGGVIAIPAMVLIYPDVPQTSIISVSLGMIFFNSLINSRNFYKKGLRSPLPPLIGLGLGMMAGVLLGTKLALGIPTTQLRLGFGILLIILGVRALLIKNKSEDQNKSPGELSPILLFPLGMAGGILSGLTGLGGGALLVPLLIFVAKIDQRFLSFISNIGMASGTMVGLIASLFIATPESSGWDENFLPLGNFYLLPALVLSLGALLSSKFAVNLGLKLDPQKRTKMFAALLLILGLIITIRITLKNS